MGLGTDDTGKTKVLDIFFASMFTNKIGLHVSIGPDIRGNVWRKQDLPSVEEDQVREHLKNPHTQVHGPDGMCPQALREVADIM